jgi:histidinol phosphatase-like PHP family hydrolase
MSGVIGTQDLHVHTDMSDGDLPLEEVVAIAAERGVTVGIADHVSTRNKERFVATEAQLRRYQEAVSGQPVFLAAEFCWCDPFAAQMPAELMERFDYRIGSNHGFALPDGTMGSPWWSELPATWADRPQEVMEVMVANLCDLVRAMPVEIVAHSTFMPKAFLTLDPDPDVWWTEEREDRYVEALAGSGVALEISNRYRLPHDRVLRKAKQAGIRFALGSDGHSRQQVARLEWAVETARRIGLTDADMFVPERKRR